MFGAVIFILRFIMNSHDLFQKFLEERPLMVITDASSGRSHQEVAKAALEGGCGALQLRDKEMSDRDYYRVAGEIRSMCEAYGVLFLVNDRVDIAMLVKADGVHLGVEDISPSDAITLVGLDRLVGYSPDIEEIRAGENLSSVAYCGAGPVFKARSKDDAGAPIGLDGLERVVEMSSVPVIAIGGIGADTIPRVLERGARGIAVISAVVDADDMEEATADLVRSLREYVLGRG